MFWRRRREEPAETPAAPETEVAPEEVEPGWEPDPSDFEDPVPEPEPRPGPELDPSPPAEPMAEPRPSSEPDAGPSAAADMAEDGETAPPPVPEPTPAYAPFDPIAFAKAPPASSLDAGLERTRGGFMTTLRGFLSDPGGPAWDDVEETLIAGDVGAALAMDIVERARHRRDAAGPEAAVRAELAALLVRREVDWTPRPSVDGGPAVVLIVGVNGTGKTTTIGKLAARYTSEGRTVILAAADTFRAAAIDQLRIWADRTSVPVIAHAPGADPGAVVYDALDAAVARGADLVIADTAGRLHTKVNLMDELTKIRRIIDKRLPGAAPETLFVLDATTGQNGLAQAKAFNESVGLTGIVLTKIDSTSKGGIVFAIEDALKVPVRFVGVGEGIDDLLHFDPDAFVEALFA
jgi:fused signal recognition particle receptor